MEIVPGLYYGIRHVKDGMVLDAATDKPCVVNEWNSGDWQRWSFQPVANGVYVVTQKQQGLSLDCATGKAPALNPTNNGGYQQWTVTDLGGGYCSIRQVVTGLALDCGDDGVYLNDYNAGDYQKWQLFPAALTWNATVDDINYVNRTEPPGADKIDMLAAVTWNNPSSARVSFNRTVSFERASSVTWQWDANLTVGIEASYKAGLPLVGGAESKLSVEFSFGVSNSYTDTETITYTDSFQVDIDPNSAVQVHVTLDWVEDFSTPYVAYMWVAANADIAGGVRALTTDEIINLLTQSGFTADNIVDRSVSDRVLVKFSGTLNGSFGTNATVVTKNVPLDPNGTLAPPLTALPAS